MTPIVTGSASIALRPAKATGIGGVGPTIVVSIGPITGGAPPYTVDFSHLVTFGSDALFRTAAHSHNIGVFDSMNVNGDGILEGGIAFASGKIREDLVEGAVLYFPPNCYIAVTDTEGQTIDVRLAQGGVQLNTLQE